VQVVAATGSTNADLAAAARLGDTGPRALAARRQDAGRGRLERGWSSPPSTSLAVSWLWVPQRPQPDWPWLPMVVGLGVVDAARHLGVGRAALKWPNDVVVPTDPTGDPDASTAGATTGLRKLAGVLVEVVPASGGTVCVVAGAGLNVGLAAVDLPVPTATSVLLETGRDPGFDAALAAVLDGVGSRLARWTQGPGLPAADRHLREDYRAACTTRPSVVHVSTLGGAVHGTAVDVDEAGCLVVRGGDGEVRVSAGDVEHVR
jgi:BirA family transcriptional regulator, biotin operon repressor / biotin---[acetyl-CoA-carboxylase] ligase